MNLFVSESFDWEGARLSSFRAVATTSLCYVLLVYFFTLSSRKFRLIDGISDISGGAKNKRTTGLKWKPWFNSDLKRIQLIHNIILIIGSAIMLYGVTIESYRRIRAEDSSWPPFLFCESPNATTTGSLYYWSYMYYLSKYYELFDTFLQLARGKPPPHFVLHVYHHAVVLLMAWAWCEYQTSLHFIGLAFNAAVHVVMYSYFLQRTLTRKVPTWKSFVTIFQIIQFFFSFVCLLVTLYIVYVQKHECAGMSALMFNLFFNATLFHSFLGVFKSGKKRKIGKEV